MKALLRSLFLASVLLATACATTGGLAGAAPRTLPEALLYAETTATAADDVAAALLNTHAITSAQARAVLASNDVVVAAVHTARAALGKGDAANAQAQLAAIAADLALLQTFLADHQSTP